MPYSREMYKVYSKMSDLELRMLRARKLRRMESAKSFNTFFARRDREVLDHQIKQIEAILETRKHQPNLL